MSGPIVFALLMSLGAFRLVSWMDGYRAREIALTLGVIMVGLQVFIWFTFNRDLFLTSAICNAVGLGFGGLLGMLSWRFRRPRKRRHRWDQPVV